MPECFGFMQTPLLHEAAAVFALTDKTVRAATVLRDPVDRFVSEFAYLQTATWEPTHTKTNGTIDEYVARGDYQRNWMVCTLVGCREQTTDADLRTAKEVLGYMLVGFTDNMPDFFDRLEVYWNIPTADRRRRRERYYPPANTNQHGSVLSGEAERLLRDNLRHDIALYQFARGSAVQKSRYV